MRAIPSFLACSRLSQFEAAGRLAATNQICLSFMHKRCLSSSSNHPLLTNINSYNFDILMITNIILPLETVIMNGFDACNFIQSKRLNVQCTHHTATKKKK